MNGQSPASRAAQSGSSPLRVAYLVNQYPSVSHTFVRREILALEAAGVTVLRYAIRGWSNPMPDPLDVAECTRTRFALKDGAGVLLKAVVVNLLRSPSVFVAALREAWALSRGGDRPLGVYLVYLAEAALIAQWMRQDKAQHLHAHFGTNSAVVAQLAARLAGVGFSFTVHGPEEFDMPAAISLAKKVAASRFVVAISSYGRSQIYRWIPRDQWSRVKVVHCGLDDQFHAGLPSVEGAAPPVDFVCVGRICEQKGQLLLVEALAVLKRRGQVASLVLAGDGDMRQVVEQRARELGVSDQLRITGWIGSAQVREAILNAGAMVLPSFAEGLPVVIMEAMALRRPVISTYVAGIPELVQTGRTGWLVPAGDVQALAETMAHCLQIPQVDWQAMGEAARQRVLERHSISTEAAKLRGHFDEAVRTGASLGHVS